MNIVTPDPAKKGPWLDARRLDTLLAEENADPSFATEPRTAGVTNRRLHQRLSLQQCQWLTSARLKYGPEVRLIDVSAGGMLVETAEPLARHSKRVFELVGPDSTIVVPSRVLRCEGVSGDAAAAGYRCAISFVRPLTLPDLIAAPKQGEPEVNSRAAARQVPHGGAVLEGTRAASVQTFGAGSAGATWQKVVARYARGEVMRGYTSNFHTNRSQLHVADHPTSTKPALVPLTALKAIFFVRDFEGDPAHVEQNQFVGAPLGRKIEVTFNDGEVLLGSTMSYRYDGIGFFVHPADPGSNNLRVFVVLAAIRHVQFLK